MIKKLALIFALACMCACARYPASGTGVGGTRLSFSIKMAAALNPNYVYIVAFNPSRDINPTTQGPIAVVAPPWGNGFVAGTATYFVRWDPTQSPRYLLYNFTDSTMLNYVTVGSPVSYTDVPSGGTTLQFDLNLAQILPTGSTESDYPTLQMNILTMDRVPQGSFGGSKVWDALGDGTNITTANQWINLDLRTASLYTNSRFSNLEPTGDVADPALDIADFSVQITKP